MNVVRVQFRGRKGQYRLFDVFAQKPMGVGIVVTSTPGSTSLTQPSQSTKY